MTPAQLRKYIRDHQGGHFYVPGVGRRNLYEMTADQWRARARWLTQDAGATCEIADLIEATPGAQTLGDIPGADGQAET